jgi:hypothetical protein
MPKTHHHKNAFVQRTVKFQNECTKKGALPNNVGQAPHLEPKESCQNTPQCVGPSDPKCSLPIQSGRVGIRTRVIETTLDAIPIRHLSHAAKSFSTLDF